MPDPIVYRVSLVEMVHAQERGKHSSTPSPFMEIRVFTFLGRPPSPVLESQLKITFKRVIEGIKLNFLPHIFESDMNFKPEFGEDKKSFSLKELTQRFRIEIEGFEVERVDLDEITLGYFKRERIERGHKLHLNTGVIYRYVAFYNPDGTIKKPDYDEFSIREVIGKLKELEERREKLLRRARGLVDEIEEKTKKLEIVIGELEDINYKFSTGRRIIGE
jgi:hypothetical protein